MKGKKLLAGLLSAVLVLGTMVMPAFADDDKDDLNVLITNATTSEITLTKDATWGEDITRDIVIDLNGKTVYLTKATPSTVYVRNSVTLKNGVVVANNLSSSADGIIMVTGTLAFEGVSFEAEGTAGGYAALIQANGGEFTTTSFDETKTIFRVKNMGTGRIIQRDNGGTVKLKDTEIYGENISGGLLNISSIKNCKIDLKNVDGYGIAATTLNTTVDGSEIKIDGAEYGAKFYKGYEKNISLTNESTFTALNTTKGDIYIETGANNGVTTDGTSTLDAKVEKQAYASINSAYNSAVITSERIYGEVNALVNRSLKVELWTDSECIATTELKDGDQGYGDMIDGTERTVTFGFNYDADSTTGSDYWTGNSFNPTIEKKPTKFKVYVDGDLQCEGIVAPNLSTGVPDDNYKWNELSFVYAPAKIGNVGYESLDAALAAAQDGNEITMYEDGEAILHNTTYQPVKTTKASVIDLNGHVMTVNDDNWYFDNKTIKSSNDGGIVKITKQVINASGVFELHYGGDLTFDNVIIDATAVTSGYSIITKMGNSNGKINFINSEIKADSTGELGIIVDDTLCSEINFTNTKMTVNNVDTNVIRGGKITISADDPKYEFNFNNVKRGLYLYDSGSLTVNGKAVVNVDAKVYGIVLGKNTPYTVADTARVNATVYRPTTAATLANTVKVSFADVTENEGEKVYNIFVEADSEKTINRLTTVQMALKLTTNADFAMTVTNINGAVSQFADGMYLFNFDGETKPSETGTKIKIGQVKLVGYGEFTLEIDDTKDNKAHATSFDGENLVTDFVPTPAEGQGTFDISASLEDVEVKVPTRKLTINVDFNNNVENQVAAYQDMTVTVTGPKSYKKVIKLGSDEKSIENNKVVIEIADELTLNETYTVEVTGAGYRTAPYSVKMNADKTLNFWNNAKDTAVEVEVGKEASKKNTTFLAGEIVKDGKINIYDLSAVVSYFGTINNVNAESEYAKYDLNRDGKIDSKDVAYVLASWGK